MIFEQFQRKLHNFIINLSFENLDKNLKHLET